jgi:hypothetical protein
MKIQRNLFVCVAIMIPQLGNAKLPFTNDIFGRLVGMLDFCVKGDPGSAPKYREVAKLLVKDLPEKEVTEARMTAEYKDSYEGIGTELPNVPKDQAIEACKASLETSK